MVTRRRMSAERYRKNKIKRKTARKSPQRRRAKAGKELSNLKKQTGKKQTYAGRKADKKVKAMHPGRRKASVGKGRANQYGPSKGKKYTETRRNRSDKNKTKRL